MKIWGSISMRSAKDFVEADDGDSHMRGKIIEILKECGADGWVEKYEKELAALS